MHARTKRVVWKSALLIGRAVKTSVPVKLKPLVSLKVRRGMVGGTAEVGAILETARSHHPFLKVTLQGKGQHLLARSQQGRGTGAG